ncbi:MAG: hypothetical protein GF401_03135 [Chitinivibrionales bacterium]|nr:hypothetical protein [Chitinivibrionales bacterium]
MVHYMRLFPFQVLLAFLLFSGCSVKKIAINSVADALSGEGSTVFTGDNDPQLVADALPFALKMYETMLEQTPEHAELHLATGKAFTLYSYAFVQGPAAQLPDEKISTRKKMNQRAKKLFLRGRNYILTGLDINHPGFRDALRQSADSALAMTTEADTAFLYWAGASWMGALTTDKFNLGLLMSMPKAVAFVEKCMEYNPAFGEGSCHEFFISYYGSIPPSMGGSEQKAREHFKKAVELSQGSKASPYMSLATSVCVKKQYKEEFIQLMKKILSIDVDAYPRNRLLNIISRRRAEWMLAHIDNFFLPEEKGAEIEQ